MKKVVKKEEKGKEIFCAIDLHDESMLVGIAVDKGEPRFNKFNTLADSGVKYLIKELRGTEGANAGARIWVAYEASGSGFRLADMLKEAGFRVSVLAPSHLPTNQKTRSNKTDKRDVLRILGVLRGHVMAGNELPEVWIPPVKLRDDREIVRQRLQAGEELTRIKNRIHGLLKRNGIKKPERVGKNWTKSHIFWLETQAQCTEPGCGAALFSLLRQLKFCLSEKGRLDKGLAELAGTPEYRDRVASVTRVRGVAILTAMTFLTELGDLSRFPNRRALASYLGLTPRSYESGEQDDRKGHISRMGPSRVRKVLNQAAWSIVRWEDEWKDWYFDHTQGGKKPLRKKMITAVMRRLGIWMWHQALAASA